MLVFDRLEGSLRLCPPGVQQSRTVAVPFRSYVSVFSVLATISAVSRRTSSAFELRWTRRASPVASPPAPSPRHAIPAISARPGGCESHCGSAVASPCPRFSISRPEPWQGWSAPRRLFAHPEDRDIENLTVCKWGHSVNAPVNKCPIGLENLVKIFSRSVAGD